MLLGIAGLIFSGCAKSEKTLPNDDEQRYVEAWVSVNHPDAVKTDLGTYIIEDKAGTGDTFDGHSYAIVQYTVTDLDGNVSYTTDKKLSQQTGSYNSSYYYGNVVWTAVYNSLYAGIEDMLLGMKVGGTRTAVIPSWLLTYSRYDNPSDYLEKSNDNSTSVYTVTLTGLSDDIIKTQADSMEVYSRKYLEGTDSTSYGFYYKEITAPADTNAFSSDTTIYINYTGKLLNGLVFDTTIENVAKDNGIYSSSKTYGPVKITWGESYSDLTMTTGSSSSSSSIISGFQKILWEMRKYGKSVGMFSSTYGYGASGSGKSIPAYSPLIFEIEIVDEP